MTSPWLTLARDILAPLPHAGAPAPSTPEPPDAPSKPALMDSQAGGDSCGLSQPPLKDRPSGLSAPSQQEHGMIPEEQAQLAETLAERDGKLRDYASFEGGWFRKYNADAAWIIGELSKRGYVIADRRAF